MTRVLIVLMVTTGLLVPTAAQGPSSRIFVFRQSFWINLHHFLYVLGRVDAGMPDITRRAVAGAPADQEAGLATLTDPERLVWRDAVATYAKGLSQKDAVFDDELVGVSNALVRAGESASLAGLGLDAALAATLERAAPVYRRAWWPKHQRANDARVQELQALLASYGDRVLAFVTRAYQEPWPGDGFPVNLSGYTNWAGAYSTRGHLLVVSSLDEGNRGALGLETIFHESMHQWDDRIDEKLQAAARRQHVDRVPDNLTHAMIFFTAGEAVRNVIPGHVPYAELNRLWNRPALAPFRPVLERAWKPYLQGEGTLDSALDEIVRERPADSDLNAVVGSTRVARQAGRQMAARLVSTSSAPVLATLIGSVVARSATRNAESGRVTRAASARPRAKPAMTSAAPAVSMRRSTDPRDAPSAMRTASSNVRRPTENATTP